jgi:DNA-binding XRE family transcriptional regulator
MSEEATPYGKSAKPKKSLEIPKRKPKKPHVISSEDTKKLMLIAEKATSLRKATNMSYEEFALHAGINRNTYFRFEKSADTGENYTVAVLLKVIRGLNISVSDFFQDIK